ncbi:hypothetical protein LX32DRAFT_335064 [Colletotrichum zoysiae]|uniref:Uncharacterized protein n=1 Tax=Colletotrichum zoysiae TaxID=1216348 RepID=A0AAD9H138_9PEZI|nr:hypothetical protein LX32DRAFT_335064 [Colletotrichum zoysiae]
MTDDDGRQPNHQHQRLPLSCALTSFIVRNNSNGTPPLTSKGPAVLYLHLTRFRSASIDVLLRAGLALARPPLRGERPLVSPTAYCQRGCPLYPPTSSPFVRDQPRCFCHALPYWPSHDSRNGRRRLVSGRMATGIRSAVASATTVGLAIDRTRDLFPPCLEPVRAAVNS